MAKKKHRCHRRFGWGHRCPESLVAELPAGVDASLFVVQHTGADNPGLLPAILELPGSRLLRVNSAAPG